MSGLQQRVDVDLLAMLRGDRARCRRATGLPSSYSMETCALAVGPQIRNDARSADVGEALGQPMGHGDGQRHQLLGLAAREPEHHALVARAERVEVVAGMPLAMLERVVHAARDVGRLLLDRGDHAAGVAVEPELRVRVPDLDDRFADDRRDVHPALGA